MTSCSYRGAQILENAYEVVYYCTGINARTLDGKPCDTDAAHYDAFGGLCRVRKAPVRLAEGKFV